MDVDAIKSQINNLIGKSTELAIDAKQNLIQDTERQAKYKKSLDKCKDAYGRLDDLASHLNKSAYDHIEHKLQFNLSILSFLCKDFKKSKQYLDKVYDNYQRKRINPIKQPEFAYLYIKLAFAFKRTQQQQHQEQSFMNKSDEQNECLERACDLLTQSSTKQKDIEYLCELLIILAMDAYHRRDSNRCAKYIDELKENIGALNDQSMTKAKIYVDLATIVSKADFKSSIAYYHEAALILQTIQQSTKKSTNNLKDMNYQMLDVTLNKNYGVVYNRHGKYQLAYQKTTQAKDLILQLLNNMENHKNHQEQLSDAINVLKQHLSDLFFNLAYSSLGLNRKDEAISHFDESFEIANEIRCYQNQIECMEAKGSIYATLTNQTKLSIECFEKAIHACEQARQENDNRMYKDIEDRLWRKLKTVSLKQTLEDSVETQKKIFTDKVTSRKEQQRQKKDRYNNNDDGNEYDEFDSLKIKIPPLPVNKQSDLKNSTFLNVPDESSELRTPHTSTHNHRQPNDELIEH